MTEPFNPADVNSTCDNIAKESLQQGYKVVGDEIDREIMAEQAARLERMRKRVTADDQQNAHTLRAKGDQLLNFLESLGASRELSLAKTKLQEAIMWAEKHCTG